MKSSASFRLQGALGVALSINIAERREMGDLIEVFKTLNGFNNVIKSAWFDFPDPVQNRHSTRSTTTIGNEGEEVDRTSIVRERARTEFRNQTFRAARAWSSLPDNVRNAKSIIAFKNAYDTWKQFQTQ